MRAVGAVHIGVPHAIELLLAREPAPAFGHIALVAYLVEDDGFLVDVEHRNCASGSFDRSLVLDGAVGVAFVPILVIFGRVAVDGDEVMIGIVGKDGIGPCIPVADGLLAQEVVFVGEAPPDVAISTEACRNISAQQFACFAWHLIEAPAAAIVGMEHDEILLDAEAEQPLGTLFHVVEIAGVEAGPVPAGCVAVRWIVAIDGDERELVGLGIGAVEILDGEQGADLVEAARFERQQCLLLHGESRVGSTESRVVGGMHPVVARCADGDVARAIGVAEVQARRIDSDGTMVAFCRRCAGERTRLAVERSQG